MVIGAFDASRICTEVRRMWLVPSTAPDVNACVKRTFTYGIGAPATPPGAEERLVDAHAWLSSGLMNSKKLFPPPK